MVDVGNFEASIQIQILTLVDIQVQASRGIYSDDGLARPQVSNVHFVAFSLLMMGPVWPDSSSDLVGLVDGWCSVRLLHHHQTVHMPDHNFAPGPFHHHQQ